jgi:hypothetical protein
MEMMKLLKICSNNINFVVFKIPLFIWDPCHQEKVSFCDVVPRKIWAVLWRLYEKPELLLYYIIRLFLFYPVILFLFFSTILFFFFTPSPFSLPNFPPPLSTPLISSLFSLFLLRLFFSVLAHTAASHVHERAMHYPFRRDSRVSINICYSSLFFRSATVIFLSSF